MGMWIARQALVVASRSSPRRAILEGAGIPCEIVPADIDERALESAAPDGEPAAVAAMLAHAKAAAVAKDRPGRLVLGADQTLAFGGRIYSKPADRAAAHTQLRSLAGRTHALHSAVAVVEGGAMLFAHVETARLTMRPVSDAFLGRYLDAVGDRVLASVGGYQLEGLGIHLFEKIEGDYFTILGLPILSLLGFFREAGHVAQ